MSVGDDFDSCLSAPPRRPQAFDRARFGLLTEVGRLAGHQLGFARAVLPAKSKLVRKQHLPRLRIFLEILPTHSSIEIATSSPNRAKSPCRLGRHHWMSSG